MRLVVGLCRFEAMGDFMSLLAAGLRDEAAVTAIEYGLLAALIVVAIIGGASATGTSLEDVFTRWTTAVVAVYQGK